MYFSTKNYLKNTHNHTIKHTLRLMKPILYQRKNKKKMTRKCLMDDDTSRSNRLDASDERKLSRSTQDNYWSTVDRLVRWLKSNTVRKFKLKFDLSVWWVPWLTIAQWTMLSLTTSTSVLPTTCCRFSKKLLFFILN